ncbi:MAG: energy-coupling factor transporter transmembrane component T [Sutterellaceae bacterium]|nr:energy-coupling factor transporter transmembrane component T [Sutterellaceae bacterium]
MAKGLVDAMERPAVPMQADLFFKEQRGDALSDKAAVLFFLIGSIATAVLKRPETALAVLLFAVMLLTVSGKRKRLCVQDAKTFAAVNAFILCLWAIVPWTTPGTTLWLWALGPLAVTVEGVRLCWVVTLKANAVFLLFLTFVAQRSITAVTAVLQSFGVPEKLTVLMTLMVRQIYYFKNEWRVLKEAAVLRGFVPGMNRATYRTTAALLSLIFIRSFERSRILNDAMLLRGFSGNWPKRTVANMRAWEKGSCAVFFVLFVGVILWDREALAWLMQML